MALIRPLKKHPLRRKIWLALAWARFLVRWVPFRRWRASLGIIGGELADAKRPLLTPQQQKQAEDIGRIVNRVANRLRMFDAVCLPRAMAARWVMGRGGLPSRIIIGSRRGTSEDGLLFHAWLMAGDVVVMGEGEREREEFMTFEKTASASRNVGDAA
ncbi:lasso peptide biosynthesis B2 protein [Erythrobacter alti]|uniref:lasso peptide biosynthesis B2 protein n=1 Tax=Erythrobacter alti TaxID=1896145 RepID=UPI0030F3AF48